MLLTTPVISTLKQNYPDAKIDVLLYQNTIPILSENPEINALYGISSTGAGTKKDQKRAIVNQKLRTSTRMIWSSKISPSVERGAYCAFLNAKIKNLARFR